MANSPKRIITQSIAEFNKYRSPEAAAELLKLEEGLLSVKFSGTFCERCGAYDYFDDFRYILERKGMKVKRENVEEMAGGAKVTFSIDAQPR